MKDKKHILLVGTSSVGKTSVSKLFEKIGYKYIGCDNLKYIDTLSSNIDTNRYYTREESFFENYTKRMFEDGFSQEKVIYDDIENKIEDLYKNTEKNLFTVMIYGTLTTLIDNMIKRRFTERREKYVFNEFYVNLYKLAVNDEDEIIDYINKKTFRDKLLNTCKYWFSSEEKLNEFVEDVFKNLDINDSNDDHMYPVCIRNNIKYDLFINIEGKTIEDVFETIQNH